MSDGTPKVGIVRHNTYTTLWQASGSQCMRKEAIGMFLRRLLVVGDQGAIHGGFNFTDHWVSHVVARSVTIILWKGK